MDAYPLAIRVANAIWGLTAGANPTKSTWSGCVVLCCAGDRGTDILKKYAEMFGLDETTGLEIPEAPPQISDEDSVRSAIVSAALYKNRFPHISSSFP